MDREFIRNYLRSRNYWWQTGKIDPAEAGFPREEYLKEIESIFELERIVALTALDVRQDDHPVPSNGASAQAA